MSRGVGLWYGDYMHQHHSITTIQSITSPHFVNILTKFDQNPHKIQNKMSTFIINSERILRLALSKLTDILIRSIFMFTVFNDINTCMLFVIAMNGLNSYHNNNMNNEHKHVWSILIQSKGLRCHYRHWQWRSVQMLRRKMQRMMEKSCDKLHIICQFECTRQWRNWCGWCCDQH